MTRTWQGSLICIVWAATVSCVYDPVGIVRVTLEPSHREADAVPLSIGSAGWANAVAVVHAVLTKHGFTPVPSDSGETDDEEMLVFTLLPTTNRTPIHANIEVTRVGLVVSLIEMGAWSSSGMANSIADEIRASLKASFGEERVR